MRHILLIQLILALSLQTIYADNITVSGSVSGTWECDTVFVTDDIDIEVGDSLIIRPGVYVAFASTHSLYVRGYIRAEGTVDNRITFDVMDTTDFSNDTLAKGGWNGIHFYYNGYTPDSSIFDFCAFYHGKAVSLDSIEEHGGAMCLRDIDRLRISNCIFENNFARYNGGAIHMEESDALIKDNLFVANRCGPTEEPWGYGGAICCDHSDARITGNYFYDNTSTGVGGAVAVRFMESMINNNIFAGNHSALGGAIGFLHYYEYPYTHCNNLMHGNSATFFGGAIANLDCGPTHVNYTLTGNISVYGGAFYVKDSLVPNVYNTIMYDNYAQEGPEVYLWDAYASANFYYCDIRGGVDAFSGSGGTGFTGDYHECIEADPQFVDADVDFHLQMSSPCIDSGTPDTSGLQIPLVDLDGMGRINNFNGNRIDMGCYELWMTGLDEAAPGPEFYFYPNPARDYFTLVAEEQAMVKIIELSGRTVLQTQCPEGGKEIRIDLGHLVAGTYLLVLEDMAGVTAEKLIILQH